jgi:hypothetical protein
MVLCTENDKAMIVHRDEEEITSAAKCTGMRRK